jgi:hypothetical protein
MHKIGWNKCLKCKLYHATLIIKLDYKFTSIQFGRPRCVFIFCRPATTIGVTSYTTQMADQLQRLMFWYSQNISSLQTPFTRSSKSACAFISRRLHHNKNKHTNAPYIARASSVVWRPWQPTHNTDTLTMTRRHGSPAQRYTLILTVPSQPFKTTSQLAFIYELALSQGIHHTTDCTICSRHRLPSAVTQIVSGSPTHIRGSELQTSMSKGSITSKKWNTRTSSIYCHFV